MISFGILFHIPDKEFEELRNYTLKTDSNKNLQDWTPDALLWLLIDKRLKLPMKQSYELAWPNRYENLYQLTTLPPTEASAAMKNYLDKWYSLHKDAPWYNGHVREKGYSGYWAWEAAAVVQLLDLDDTSFKDNPFYPYDAVHWSA
jgi:hypothetical protein